MPACLRLLLCPCVRCAAGTQPTPCLLRLLCLAAGYQVLSVTASSTLPKTACDMTGDVSYGNPFLFQQCMFTSSGTTQLSVYVDQYCNGERCCRFWGRLHLCGRRRVMHAGLPAGWHLLRAGARPCCRPCTHQTTLPPHPPTRAVQITPMKDTNCSEPGQSYWSNVRLRGFYVTPTSIRNSLNTAVTNLTSSHLFSITPISGNNLNLSYWPATTDVSNAAATSDSTKVSVAPAHVLSGLPAACKLSACRREYAAIEHGCCTPFTLRLHAPCAPPLHRCALAPWRSSAARWTVCRHRQRHALPAPSTSPLWTTAADPGELPGPPTRRSCCLLAAHPLTASMPAASPLLPRPPAVLWGTPATQTSQRLPNALRVSGLGALCSCLPRWRSTASAAARVPTALLFLPLPTDQYQPYLGQTACLECSTTTPRKTSAAGSDYCMLTYVSTTCPSGAPGRERPAALGGACLAEWSAASTGLQGERACPSATHLPACTHSAPPRAPALCRRRVGRRHPCMCEVCGRHVPYIRPRRLVPPLVSSARQCRH